MSALDVHAMFCHTERRPPVLETPNGHLTTQAVRSIAMAKRVLRPITIIGQDAFIPLTRGYTAVIDAADVPLVSAWNWCAKVTPRAVYARRADWSDGRHRDVLMHRVIAAAPDGIEVDHKFGNGLDNRRSNLRLATQSQNQHNQRLSRRNTSGAKGVSFHKARGKWQARIGISGKSLYLGLFDTPEEAHAAYCAASARLHGDFGRVQ